MYLETFLTLQGPNFMFDTNLPEIVSLFKWLESVIATFKLAKLTLCRLIDPSKQLFYVVFTQSVVMVLIRENILIQMQQLGTIKQVVTNDVGFCSKRPWNNKTYAHK